MLVAIPVLALLGCGDGGPTCGAVGNKAVELVRAEIAAEPDAEARQMMESMLGPLKDGVVDKCEHQDWSEADLRCFARADTLDAADACAAAAGDSAPAGGGDASGSAPPE